MDCSQFRDNHVAFVDDTLAGIELVRMQRHIAECATCAGHDAGVRRALLVFRNIPRIDCSPDFSAKLEARIRETALAESLGSSTRNARIGGVAAVVVSALLLGYVIKSLPAAEAGRDIVMPPVVATVPALEIPHMESAGPAIVASVSTGLPIWTAALYAEQAPAHFSRPEIILANYTR